MLDRETFAAWILAFGLLLAALGSLRDVVTPLGYWALWAAWGLGALGASQWTGPSDVRQSSPPAWVWGSFVTLILGMLLSGWANHSAVTVYQAAKIGVIGLCCWIAWRLAAVVEWRLRVPVLQGVVAAVVLVFLASKAAPAGYYLDLGSAGREGSFLAWPGVIWKAGAFFMPLCLAAMVTHPGRWIANGLAVAGCVFLVVVDGSRTGLLVVGLTVLAFGVLLVWRRDWRSLSAARRALILCVPALFGLLVLSTGVGYLSHGSAVGFGGAPVAMSGTAKSTAEALVEAAVDPVASTRLGQGDPQRMRLLRNGIEQSVDCLPLGCGFGSTALDPGYGVAMHVHNAYLAALADFGVLGLAGMLGLIIAAALPLWRVLRDPKGYDAGEMYCVVASAGAALAYLGALMLHTFSSEMSEWGYLILMLAFAWRAPVQC